jgi:hypothetical protein
MIRLTKGPKPDVLTRNADTWTRELLDAIAAGQELSAARRTRYNNKEIKDALLRETREKCAYCESKFRHVTYGDIEHITPKDNEPGLTYEWTNLTIACDICNTNKARAQGLVDPYNDSVDDSFKFRGPMICAVPGNDRGRLSVVVLDLNRLPLLERRKEKIDELNLRLAEILATQDVNARQLLAQALVDFARNSAEQYSACATEHVQQLRAEGHLPANVQ